MAIEVEQKKKAEILVNHYYMLKSAITLEELQTVYNSIYPDDNKKLNSEDWAVCNINIENNDYEKTCEYFEKINNRIDISRSSSLQMSELFMNRLVNQLNPYNKQLCGTIETFCNDENHGLILSLLDKITDEKFYVWVCETVENKDIMIICSKEKAKKNLFMLDDYENAQYFNISNLSDAINYASNRIDDFLTFGLDRVKI